MANEGTPLQRMFQGGIQVVEKNKSSWKDPRELVKSTEGQNNYYPAIAPTNDFVVFNRSFCPANEPQHFLCNGDTDPSAALYGIQTTGGKPPVLLARANAPGKGDGDQKELTNSFPKWSPFITRKTLEGDTKLVWLTFSSTRQYGLRPPPSGGVSEENKMGSLLWMVAIDPDKLKKGEDPSYAAFALPFQDLNTSNHIAQWTARIAPQQCRQETRVCDPSRPCCDGLTCFNAAREACAQGQVCTCQGPVPSID